MFVDTVDDVYGKVVLLSKKKDVEEELQSTRKLNFQNSRFVVQTIITL